MAVKMSLAPTRDAEVLDQHAHIGYAVVTRDAPVLVAHLRVSPRYLLAKRLLDVALSTVALLILSPLLALTALAVRLTSPGPILFRQQRVGEGGRIFTIYKFRSMRHENDDVLHQIAYVHFIKGTGGDGKVGHHALSLAGLAEGAPATARLARRSLLRRIAHPISRLFASEDPRVTTVGAIIRKLSIDELPQLFNVLRGDMSLVGPRPPIPYEVRHYGPLHLQRLRVQPGITGKWQVEGRNQVAFERMVEMDLEYIRERSLWLDLRLMLRTIPSLWANRHAK